MKFKSFLFGSVAAVAAAGGAQAADLTIAEPVDYVRVCDAFGVGYWYIPGTDTCIKIGGEVNFFAAFQKGGWEFGKVKGHWTIEGETNVIESIDPRWTNAVDTIIINTGTNVSVERSDIVVRDTQVVQSISTQRTSVAEVTWVSGVKGHRSQWKFVTEAIVDFTAKSMTEYGALIGYVKLKGVYDPNPAAVNVDEAWLSLGHLTFGHLGSVQNTSNGYADAAWRPDTSTNQIRLSWAAGGFGIMLGIEDPRERWGTALVDGKDEYSMPDITGAITVAGGHVNAKLTAGFGAIEDKWNGSWDNEFVYGVAGTVEAVMDQFSIMAGGAFGTGLPFVGAGHPVGVNGANNWQAFVSAKFQATPAFSVAGTYAMAGTDAGSGLTATAGGAKLVWAPVAGFQAYAEGKAWKIEGESAHTWDAKIGVKRTW
jgi:hypothetical protein